MNNEENKITKRLKDKKEKKLKRKKRFKLYTFLLKSHTSWMRLVKYISDGMVLLRIARQLFMIIWNQLFTNELFQDVVHLSGLRVPPIWVHATFYGGICQVKFTKTIHVELKKVLHMNLKNCITWKRLAY